MRGESQRGGGCLRGFAAEQVSAEAGQPLYRAARARGSRARRGARRRVCIAGSALDPAGAAATGSGPARVSGQGAALSLGR